MFHIIFQFFVDPLFICSREITQVYAFRGIFINTSYKVLVNILCHERNHRGSHFGNGHQCGIQCHICIDFILFHSFCPETLAASSYIPVTHVIHELLKCSCSFRDPIICQIVIYSLDDCIQFGQQPFVHDRQLVIFQFIFGRIKFINICIQYEECISIPQSTHELSLTFLYCFSVETVWKPRSTVNIEIPADCICTVSFQCFKRIYRISLGFTHLLTIFILYMTQNDNILIRSLIKQQGGFCQQRVEPSTSLVNRLGNKLCRELLFKQFFIFKWVMMLCKWHCSRVKPAVNHLRYTMHRFSTNRTCNGNLINIWAMQFHRFCSLVTAHLKQFLTASDGMHMTALTLPDIQRSSPVTVSGNTPVLNIFQPVAETSFSDTLRNPVNGVVVADQVILHCSHLDKPGFTCIVNQWCITSPAVWIIMLKLRSIKQQSFCFQIFQYFRISALHIRIFLHLCFGRFCSHSCKWSFRSHTSFLIYKFYKRKVVLTSYTSIILTKCRCDMNDTGTIGHSYIIITDYIMCFLVLFLCFFGSTLIQCHIFFIFQVSSFVSFQNFISRLIILCQFAQNFVQKCLCHVIYITVCSFHFAICVRRVHTKCYVRRQRPRCCGPCQEIGIFPYNLETHYCRTLFYCLISLCHFLCRQRSSTTRAVRNNLKPFIQKSFVPDLFQCPPLRLNIIVMIRNIRVIHISPETYG